MKIQLDTTEKSIKIQEQVNFGELIEMLEKLLPNGLWKEFELEVNAISNLNSPIIINPISPYQYYPWWQQPIVVTNHTTYNPAPTINTPYCSLNSGIYNIEMDNSK